MHNEMDPNTAEKLEQKALEPEAVEIDLPVSIGGIYGSCPFCPAKGVYHCNLVYPGNIYYDLVPAFAYKLPPSSETHDWPTSDPGETIQALGYHQPICTGFYYTVQYGDTLWALSLRFGVRIQALMKANPHLYDPNLIYAGQILCIPFPPAPRTCRGFHYTIRSGDSLYTLALHYGISLSTLIRANPQIMDPNIIYPGQIICVPRVKPHKPCKGFLYTARPGDTIHKIARRFGIPPADILRANPQMSEYDRIYPGQVICIPEGHKGHLYTIQRGDKLFDIAHNNEVSLAELVKANPEITAPQPFFVGQVIYIPEKSEEKNVMTEEK